MHSKVFQSFDEAVADVPDGATIMIPGFGGVGMPRNLIAALVRQEAKNLTIIANHPGHNDGQMDVDTLIEHGQVKKAICAFTAPAHPSRPSIFDRLYNEGQIEGELVPQGTLTERIRAAGAGIGAFYTRTGVGTLTAEDKELRVIGGREYLLEYALHADYAFIRAYRADEIGNLQYRLAQRNFNPIMAMAARTTIAEVEQDIVAPGGIDPDQVHTPSLCVHRVVRIPSEGIWDRIIRN